MGQAEMVALERETLDRVANGITLGYHRLFTHRSFETTRSPRMLPTTSGTSSPRAR